MIMMVMVMVMVMSMVMVMVILMTVAMAVTMTMRCVQKDSKQNRWRSSKLGQNTNAKKVGSKLLFGRRRGGTTGRTVLCLDFV